MQINVDQDITCYSLMDNILFLGTSGKGIKALDIYTFENKTNFEYEFALVNDQISNIACYKQKLILSVDHILILFQVSDKIEKIKDIDLKQRINTIKVRENVSDHNLNSHPINKLSVQTSLFSRMSYFNESRV